MSHPASGERWGVRLVRLTAVGLSVLAWGCSGVDRDIRGRDHHAVLPTFRTVIDLREYDNRRNRKTFELEVDLAGADGEYRSGGSVKSDYRLTEAAASVRLGQVLRDKLRFTGLLGVAYTRLELEDRSGTPPVDDTEGSLGVRIGGEFRAEIAPVLSFHTRVTLSARPFDRTASQSEIGLLFHPFSEAGLLVGWKSWRFDDQNSRFRGIDDVDLRIEGLFIGMELRF